MESGKSDIIGLGRPLPFDPDWGVKIAADKPETVRRCLFCNKEASDISHAVRDGYDTACAI